MEKNIETLRNFNKDTESIEAHVLCVHLLYFIVPPEVPVETEKKDKKGKKGKGKIATKESKPNIKAAAENEAKGKINTSKY